MSTVANAPFDLRLPVAVPRAPYRGIEPFRVVDRAIFFGREAEVRKLFRMATIYRGVLLYGDSGAGKSSLVNAGFIPLSVQEGMAPERLRVQPKPGREVVLERIPVGPGDGAPYLGSLLVEGTPDARIVLSAAELLERVRRASRPFVEADREAETLPPRPLLIFDQFEEFVTLFEEAPGEEAAPARAALLELLAGLLRDDALPVKVLFVFREDYLAKLNLLFERVPELPDHFLRIAQLPPASLPAIIRGPFDRVEGLFPRELARPLAEKLRGALEQRSQQGLVNLTEVQIACLQLWEVDDPEALFERAGVEGLLSGYLEDALAGLPEELRDPAVVVLTRLVTAAGTRNVVSREDIAQRHAPGDPEPGTLALAVDALEKTALVRREARHNVYFYEITSEFLVPWIHGKRNERRARAEREAVRAAERRKRRTAYAIGAVTLALAVLVFVVSFLVNSTERQVRWARAGQRSAQAAKARSDRARDAVRDTLRRTRGALGDARRALQVERGSARDSAARSTGAIATLLRDLAEVTRARDEALRGEQAGRAALDTAAAHSARRLAEISRSLNGVIAERDGLRRDSIAGAEARRTAAARHDAARDSLGAARRLLAQVQRENAARSDTLAELGTELIVLRQRNRMRADSIAELRRQMGLGTRSESPTRSTAPTRRTDPVRRPTPPPARTDPD
ncbi:MAG TPA: hypothetical protein VFQ45_03090 [Longimicrobium sp.]|nr:hypothetical protein [Longimicrobium sp.]